MAHSPSFPTTPPVLYDRSLTFRNFSPGSWSDKVVDSIRKPKNSICWVGLNRNFWKSITNLRLSKRFRADAAWCRTKLIASAIISMSAKKKIRQIPLSLNIATTGSISFVNTLRAIARPKGSHANSSMVHFLPEMFVRR